MYGLFYFNGVDATEDTGVAWYFNDNHHKPNLWVKLDLINGEKRPVFIASRNITAYKDKLVYNYGKTKSEYYWRYNHLSNISTKVWEDVSTRTNEQPVKPSYTRVEN